MGRLLRRRPSPAMLVALLALFVALGGSTYAATKIRARDIRTGAVGSRAIANNSIRSSDIRNAVVTGQDVKDDSLTNADIDNTSLRALSASSATTATRATNATNAGNADRLDGIDSTSFTRRACTSSSGAIKGVVTIDASATFSGTFAAVPGYNCSGQSIEARRLSMGRYEVRFNGSPVTQAVATAVVAGFKADMVSVTNQSPGLFTVYVLDPLPAPGAFVDDDFTMITP
jgi:hypothetical protein